MQANPTALSSYHLNLEDLRAAHRGGQRQPGQGKFRRPRKSYTIGANDQLLTSADYKPLIVAYRNGAPVTLSDVADVIDDAENVKQAAWMNDDSGGDRQHPAAAGRQHHRRGRPREEAAAAACRPRCRRRSTIAILTDRTTTIRASVEDVQFELMLTVGLVVMVIFLFLRNAGGHDHSQRGGAAVAGRHVRRDVPAGLQPEQPDADGADDLDRLRGRRRDRDDREHRALYRRRRSAAGGRAARARSRSASRSCR